MGFRMSIPYLGLTRKVGESGKHKAHGLGICKEAGYERASKSRTLDRTLSDQNVYEGYTSGEELWEEIERRASSYKVEVKGKTKSGESVTRTRGLRKDAIVAFAVIYKPPAEVIRGWDSETRDRFFKDCHEVSEMLEPELFQPSNILMRALHCDEKKHGGEDHEHDIGVPLTADGRYNGSDMLNHMRINFNKNFAQAMRKRGWDMDDLDLYDPERARTDADYVVERRAKRREQGLSVNEHARRDNEQKATEAKAAEIQTRESELEALRQQQETAAQKQALEAGMSKLYGDEYEGEDGERHLGLKGMERRYNELRAATRAQRDEIAKNDATLKAQRSTIAMQSHEITQTRVEADAIRSEADAYAARTRTHADEDAEAVMSEADAYLHDAVAQAQDDAVEIRSQAHAELDAIRRQHERIDQIADDASIKVGELDAAIADAQQSKATYDDARGELEHTMHMHVTEVVRDLPQTLAEITAIDEKHLSIIGQIWDRYVRPIADHVGSFLLDRLTDNRFAEPQPEEARVSIPTQQDFKEFAQKARRTHAQAEARRPKSTSTKVAPRHTPTRRRAGRNRGMGLGD